MLIEFTMPKLGHLMEEGKVVRWAKAPGERIRRGEPLLEVEMDKATLEVESPVTGIVRNLMVTLDEVVPVGAPLAIIETNDTATQ